MSQTINMDMDRLVDTRTQDTCAQAAINLLKVFADYVEVNIETDEQRDAIRPLYEAIEHVKEQALA